MGPDMSSTMPRLATESDLWSVCHDSSIADRKCEFGAGQPRDPFTTVRAHERSRAFFAIARLKLAGVYGVNTSQQKVAVFGSKWQLLWPGSIGKRFG